MNPIQAIILGIVEGLTEFLPISSTFHLLFANQIMGMPLTDFAKFFDVFIQSAAILSVVVLFGKEWLTDWDFLKKVAVSFIPTAIVGLVLHKVIKDVFFDSNLLMISAFLIVGILFVVVEALVKKGTLKTEKKHTSLTYTEAVLIGVFQALAVVPGVSRAGAVIVGMMVLGYRRDEAAKYSFSLAVPTILAASALDLIKMRSTISGLETANLLPLLIGSVAAFISAFFIVKWFIQFLKHRSLNVFGGYRLIVGALLLLFGFGR